MATTETDAKLLAEIVALATVAKRGGGGAVVDRQGALIKLNRLFEQVSLSSIHIARDQPSPPVTHSYLHPQVRVAGVSAVHDSGMLFVM
jgi:hypothetical protein